MASPRVVGEKEVTFNHLAVFNNPEQDNDLVGQSDSPPKVRISSKCKWFIGIALMVAVALGFLTVGLLVTFSYKKRETKELIVDGVNVKIEEVRNQKWSRFQTSTTGIMYKTTVGDQTKIEVYDEDTGATVRIGDNQLQEVAVKVDALIENALSAQGERNRLLEQEETQGEVITYDEVKHKLQKKLKEITKRKSGKQVEGAEETVSLLQTEGDTEQQNDTGASNDETEDQEGEQASSSKGQKKGEKSKSKQQKRHRKSKKMQRRGLGNSAEVDSFVNYIANDYSDRIDLALQATQGEPAVSSPSKKDSSKQSSIMANCFTISLNPPTFLCTDRPNEDPSPAQTEDSSESSQFILKVSPN